MIQRLVAILSRTEVWVGALALAAFLVVYWVLRGAPIGQSARDDEAGEGTSAGYRDRVVAAVTVGLLLVLAGAYVAMTKGVPWSLPVFALGFGTVLTLVAVNRRYRHGSPTLRRTVEFSNTALTASLIAGILIVVNVMAFRYGGRAIDLTREHTFSLESLTLNQLKALEKPVVFTIVYGQSDLAVRQLERVRQLMDLYKAANSSKVRLEYVNPFNEVEKYESLLKRVPEVGVLQSGGILIELGEGETAEHSVVRNNDLFEVPRRGRSDAENESFKSIFHGEDAVTSALIRLREANKPKVAFTTGHGEASPDEIEPNRPGVGLLKSRLAALGSEVTELNLVRDDVPKDLSLLLVVGPRSPFKPEEVGKLRAYADRGGPLLVLVGNQEKTGLDEFLSSFNVAIGPGLVVEPKLNINHRPLLVVVPILGQLRHPVVDSLINRTVFLLNAAPILGQAAGVGTAVNGGVIAAPILRTSKESWAETDLSNPRLHRDEGKDKPGPLIVGVAVSDRPKPGEAKEGKPRLVVFSCRYMAENPFLEMEPTNLDLLMNSVHWLRGRTELRGVAPKTHVDLTLSSDPVLRWQLTLVPTVMAVLLIIGLGITTYVARRE